MALNIRDTGLCTPISIHLFIPLKYTHIYWLLYNLMCIIFGRTELHWLSPFCMKYQPFTQDFSKELFLVPAPADHPPLYLQNVCTKRCTKANVTEFHHMTSSDWRPLLRRVDPCFMCRLILSVLFHNKVIFIASMFFFLLLRRCRSLSFFRMILRNTFTIIEFESEKLLWSLPPFDNVNCLISKITNSPFVAVVVFVFHFPLV